MKGFWTKGKGFLLLCLAAVFFVVGCSSDQTGKIFRYDISAPVYNLDPLYATDEAGQMIVYNIFEGLLSQTPDGLLVPAVAREYTQSPDGLHYRFTLREDAHWRDGTPITAEDFVFTFRRMFRSDMPSPFASNFVSIQNASNVLAGIQPESEIGVVAKDAHTLEFTLEYEDSFFLENLATSAAMPCNQSFFTEAKGRYGLEKKFVNANGPFYLDYWDNSKAIRLRQNQAYAQAPRVLAAGVNFYIGREDPTQQFLKGNSDMSALSYAAWQKVQDKNYPATAQQKTVWCLVFNLNDPVYGNALIRQGLAHSLNRQPLEEYLKEPYSLAMEFVPPAVQFAGESFRQQAGSTQLLTYNSGQGKRLFELGMNGMELQSLPRTTLYVPEDSDHMLYMGLAQQSWQKHLSAYINLEPLPQEKLNSRYKDGNFQMMLLPFTPDRPGVYSFLDLFSTGEPHNITGYQSPLYDDILSSAQQAHRHEQAAELFAKAESQLLQDAVVIPLYYETSYSALAPGVAGIEWATFGSRITFWGATKP